MYGSLSAPGTRRGSAVKTPATPVKISHASAPSAAASATAVVSQPPRPSAVAPAAPGCGRGRRGGPPARKARDQEDLVLLERLGERRRGTLDDLRLRVRAV